MSCNFSKFKVNNTALPEFLISLRKELNYSTEKMAKKLVMSSSSYNGYETGQTKNITPEMLTRLTSVCYEKLYKDTKTYDAFILMKINRQMVKYSSDYLVEQLWMHYLSLKHTYADLNGAIIKKIEDLYETDVWTVIFRTLNANPTIKKKHLYSEYNEIYIKPLTPYEKESNYLPIFRINYKLSNEDISQKQGLAFNNGKIAITDLFMLIFNKEFDIQDNEQDAFVNTCKTLFTLGTTIIYNQLGVIDLPKDRGIPIDKETIQFINELSAFLKEKKELETLDYINVFSSNVTDLGLKYINTVAIDFSFIKDLSNKLRFDLKDQIYDVVEKFKKEYIGN